MKSMTLHNFLLILSMAGTAGLCLSCDNIYDDPIEQSAESSDGSFSYIDATDYTKWVYLNLKDGTSLTLDHDNTADIPAEWTFAMHRYDCKTNGGAVCETAYTSIESMEKDIANGKYSLPQADKFVSDTDGQITIDMSHMMDGYLLYADSPVNEEMGKWLDVNTSSMPPIYTMSDKVYLLRLADGTVAAVRFTAFSNPYNYDTKGYISFDYTYPINFE